jgi:RND family efflux transporter MFP subunit
MPPLAHLLKDKIVLASLAATGVILIGSVAYYFIEVRPPALTYAAVTRGSVTEDVTGTGTVSPVENPDLSFVAGGRVTLVNVKVGDTVSSGQVLAALDTGVLSANYAAANATYQKLAGGPRDVDVAGKRTAVTAAQTTLDNAYGGLPSVIANADANAEDAVHSVDSLFGSFNTVDYPRVNFFSREGAADKAGQERGALTVAFAAWDRDVRTLTSSSSPETLDAALDTAVTRLTLARDFFADLSTAVNGAEPPLSSTEVATVAAARSTVNSLVVSLLSMKQTLSSDRLALTSAQDALNQTLAGAAPEDIAVAKAQADAAAAALRQSEIIAPYAGTVARVAVKSGDVVGPNTAGVSVIPQSSFEVEVYVSEIDAAKLTAGEKADVTLDAFGPDTVFPATLASVDRAPTVVNGVPSFKATVVFDQADPKLSVGQGANVTIHIGQKDNVLLVPRGAVITKDNQTYVLKETARGSVLTPVTVGLIGGTDAEIISGLAEGDRVARVAGQ